MEKAVKYDVVVIGAGAAGFMCAIEAGKRGKSVCLIDHSTKIAEKIRISGGGRCNFTNLNTNPSCFLSNNKNFCKSALSQYTQFDFIELVDRYKIKFHEKKLGQLFCDNSSNEIINMLLSESRKYNVTLKMNTKVEKINCLSKAYEIKIKDIVIQCKSLVIASGGLSIPKIGASAFGYDIASQFNINIIKTSPGLVPLQFDQDLLTGFSKLSGLSVNANISMGKITFEDDLLFTHKGLSGPSVLQISSYWESYRNIVIDFHKNTDINQLLLDQKENNPKKEIQNILATFLPRKLALLFCDLENINGQIANIKNDKLKSLSNKINYFNVIPIDTEGYRIAEVTVGGIDTKEISSKTMEVKKQSGLYFIGEVLDVTGHLGGYNFQWAWSSGYVAGNNV
ncbi:NAD(P)/FAD-dependent oxidoreductase [Hyphomicrobiales bacterium]|jgi:predicted Rossmann fold flavoprotein|nr:NAD(P)/FAD-dependent oxidoreductase [Hyphomicrobiales bacterium]MDC3272224.1 NAD(P)/FAD-dependent oxidoreductase [Hyphomicrobiales bacterium]|tara:strand:+ start:1354 stop:2541 length:1188 start_codon:yes stop_codon:yes gene_type:complete